MNRSMRTIIRNESWQVEKKNPHEAANVYKGIIPSGVNNYKGPGVQAKIETLFVWVINPVI